MSQEAVKCFEPTPHGFNPYETIRKAHPKLKSCLGCAFCNLPGQAEAKAESR